MAPGSDGWAKGHEDVQRAIAVMTAWLHQADGSGGDLAAKIATDIMTEDGSPGRLVNGLIQLTATLLRGRWDGQEAGDVLMAVARAWQRLAPNGSHQGHQGPPP